MLAYTYYSTADKIIGCLILGLFVLWITLEVLNIRAKVLGWFERREVRAHTDETLAEMYTAHTYAGTRAESQRRQRGG